MKRDLEKILREFDGTKSNLDAAVKDKERYSKESVLANRKINDIEMLVRRVQEENNMLKKDLNASQGKLSSLHRVVERATVNHNQVVNEANIYKENAERLESEVIVFKEETSNYQSQVCTNEGSNTTVLVN